MPSNLLPPAEQSLWYHCYQHHCQQVQAIVISLWCSNTEELTLVFRSLRVGDGDGEGDGIGLDVAEYHPANVTGPSAVINKRVFS